MKPKLPKAFNTSLEKKAGHSVNSPFVPGNQLSTLENMPKEAHERRMAAMYKGWKTKVLQSKGVKVVTKKQKENIEIRKRVKLRETIIREAREIQDMARMAAAEAMDCLIAIMKDPDSRPNDRLNAVNILLDRAYGKATQTNVNANVDANGKESDISTAELQRRVEAALNRIEAVAGGTGEEGESQDRPADVCEYDRDPDSSTKH